MADENSNASATPVTTPRRGRPVTGNVPKKDKDLGTVSTNVVANWKSDPSITLRWKSVAEFEPDVINFNKQIEDRDDASGNRPEVTARLKVLDAAVDKGTKYIKSYLEEDFEDQATAQYAKYGIEKNSKGYFLPIDRNKRISALAMMVKGIKNGGYNTRKYGKAYFEPLVAEYKTLFALAGTTDSSVTTLVGDKNLLRKEIEKVLRCLILNIRSNYPDTAKNVLRAWGFQKEKY